MLSWGLCWCNFSPQTKHRGTGMIGVLDYDLYNIPLWNGIISWYQLLVLICPMGPSIHLRCCSIPVTGWTKKKHLQGLKNEALRIQKGKESLEDGILSSHICPPLQLEDIKIWIMQAQLRWAMVIIHHMNRT